MISKEYKQAFQDNLPIFCVFILGAIAQQIIITNISFVLKLLGWCGMYLIAIKLHDLLFVNIMFNNSKCERR
jgi:hypothetical protein